MVVAISDDSKFAVVLGGYLHIDDFRMEILEETRRLRSLDVCRCSGKFQKRWATQLFDPISDFFMDGLFPLHHSRFCIGAVLRRQGSFIILLEQFVLRFHGIEVFVVLWTD